jgi:hypothetical protein
MAGLTKTELKVIAMAKERVEPFYKRVAEYVQACPFCLGQLCTALTNGRVDGYYCDCGHWKHDWITHTWTYQKMEESKA